MKELIALLCLVLATSSPLAFAREQGADRKPSVVKAEKRAKVRKPPTERQLAHQQRMKDCSRKAARQKLKGDDRRQFMKACLKG